MLSHSRVYTGWKNYSLVYMLEGDDIRYISTSTLTITFKHVVPGLYAVVVVVTNSCGEKLTYRKNICVPGVFYLSL